MAKSKNATVIEWIGKRCRELRLRKQMTLKQVANNMGLQSHSVTSDIEGGQYDMKITTLLKCVKAMGVTPGEFFASMPPDIKIFGSGRREPTRERG